MNLDFSPEQEVFRTQLRRLLAARESRKTVRRLAGTAAIDDALWQALAEMGALGAHIPEVYGGGGQRLDLCVVAEELGRALSVVPAIGTLYLYVELLLEAGDEALRQKILPAVAAGRATGTLALTEEVGSAFPRVPGTVLRDGALWGAKIAVPDGAFAQAAIVLARESAGASLFWVDLNDASVQRRPQAGLDLAARLAQLSFQGTPALRLGEAGAGIEILLRALDRSAVYVAFEQLGGAQAMLEMAREHALQRYAFGRPIGSLQVIKHRLADLFVATELARSNCYHGAWAAASGASELPLAAASARVSAGRAFENCAAENIQVHGALGFTWESDCHLYYRRAKALSLLLGPELWWKQRLVTHLERKAA